MLPWVGEAEVGGATALNAAVLVFFHLAYEILYWVSVGALRPEHTGSHGPSPGVCDPEVLDVGCWLVTSVVRYDWSEA